MALQKQDHVHGLFDSITQALTRVKDFIHQPPCEVSPAVAKMFRPLLKQLTTISADFDEYDGLLKEINAIMTPNGATPGSQICFDSMTGGDMTGSGASALDDSQCLLLLSKMNQCYTFVIGKLLRKLLSFHLSMNTAEKSCTPAVRGELARLKWQETSRSLWGHDFERAWLALGGSAPDLAA